MCVRPKMSGIRSDKGSPSATQRGAVTPIDVSSFKPSFPERAHSARSVESPSPFLGMGTSLDGDLQSNGERWPTPMARPDTPLARALRKHERTSRNRRETVKRWSRAQDPSEFQAELTPFHSSTRAEVQCTARSTLRPQ